jgi:FtsP/CotA-like multicopper oxidase with cupredoxin domain
LKRRSFLKAGALSAAAASAASLPTARVSAAATSNYFALTIAPANAQMIDGVMVYVLAYFLDSTLASAELRVREGQTITIDVINNDFAPHGFAIPGIPSATIPQIASGATARVSFVAPPAGSFLYVDPYKAPLNRILGLHGAFIVEPVNGLTTSGSPTPFSQATHSPQVAALFNALGGGSPRFPGNKWDPADPAREKLWLFSQTDPLINAAVAAKQTVDPAKVVATFLPRYFTINGLSGFDTAVHGGTHLHSPGERIMASGRQGQPTLVRTMNAGLATHSVHIHGNHCMIMTESSVTGVNYCETNVYERDVWMLKPMHRIDVLLPFERPPDIPAAAWPMKEEPWPLRYVMHCHCEMSQTAGGGNYPQGACTHWEMTGPL